MLAQLLTPANLVKDADNALAQQSDGLLQQNRYSAENVAYLVISFFILLASFMLITY